MKSIAGILVRGTTSADGKSYTVRSGRAYLLADGFDPRPPNTEERFWVGQKTTGWWFWRKTVSVAIPFEVVGYGPLGQ